MKEEVKNKITEVAESLGFAISFTEEDEESVDILFSEFSSYGQDFNVEITVDTDADMMDIWRELHTYWKNFDVSAEAYLWLDESGHGKNGAPYEMIDVYKDMQECEGFIEQLADKVYEIAK